MSRGDEVSVTLMLNGGHTRTVYLGRKDPLLSALLVAVRDKTDPTSRAKGPFNIAVEQGRQSLIFSSADLVGLLLDPPMIPEARRPAANERPVERARYLVVENFLDKASHAELLKFVAAQEKKFSTSTVTTDDADYRRSKVLYDFPRFSELFRRKMREAGPKVMQELKIPPFAIGEIECQLTAHHEGNYFKLHNDNGSPQTASRALTYVYYFHQEPKAFSGGAIRLYDSEVVDGVYRCGPHAVDLEPKNNSILFFPSHLHHEVLPVSCPKNRFMDGRFTINGWLRREAVQEAAE